MEPDDSRGADTAAELRQKAARYRRYAAGISNDAARKRIEALADELEEQAAQLEAEE
jgi:hypothetical protein